jgi:hypothetical protein
LSAISARRRTTETWKDQSPPPTTPNVRYFFDKQMFADTPIDYRCAPIAVFKSQKARPLRIKMSFSQPRSQG